MTERDVIVIGASAGGVRALRTLLSLLPASPPIAVFIALHRGKSPKPHSDIDPLATLLRRETNLQVMSVQGQESIEFGTIYVPPPGFHLVIEADVVRARENPQRDASPHTVDALFRSTHTVDALFRSAAHSYKRRVVGVVLTGMLNDGTAGFWEIRKRGGITIVQDPAEAEHPSMPRSAMEEVPVHYCLPLSDIAAKLVELAVEPPVDATAAFRPRVLIAEDERVIALNLEKRLMALGYHVVGSVASGEEVLDCIARTSPDIVLMDIHLSGEMPGTTAGAIIWRQFGIPIVYLTAYSDQKTLDSAKPSMPYGYIVKPFRPAEVHAAIQLVLDRRERELRLHE